MFTRLLIFIIEGVLCFFRIVDTTKREIARDYPALHGARR